MSRDRSGELTTARHAPRESSQRARSDMQSASAHTLHDNPDFYAQITHVNADISTTELNITAIAGLHGRLLGVVSGDENRRLTRQVDDLMLITSDLMNSARTALSRLAAETKRLQGREQGARKAQQGKAARRLMDVARKYETVQTRFKDKYKERIARELKIARPDATPEDIQHAVESNGAVFAQQMLNSRVGEQRRILQDISSRHHEIEKIEESVEQLANLFQDMQILLEQQQDTINVIETHVGDAQAHMEEGGRQMTQAIAHRVASRKKLWWISGICLALLIILVIIAYTQRCNWFPFVDPKCTAAPATNAPATNSTSAAK